MARGDFSNMSTRTIRFINFSISALRIAAICFFACLAGICLHQNFAQAQPSNPRAETDSRPTEPIPPTATPVKAALKPTPTPALVKATPKPGSKVPVKPTPVPALLEVSRKFPKVVTKLMIDDLSPGRGRMTKPGSKLVVHFQSWLYDPTQPLGRGPQFESTQGKAPYKFTLQNAEAPHIKGWEEGLIDMKVGGKRRLIIPPDLAYGANGAGQVIPPGATLLYEIELVDVE
jgi:FKBP-type peptidyl-prolyl cis-trans isomerase FkpA